MSDNRWIISQHKYHEHKTYEGMQQELARLRLAHPEKKFRVYRIKRSEIPSASGAAPEAPIQPKETINA
jgi:hypothetical protein